MALKWVCGRFDFDLNKTGPLLMGIINVTPDSFSGDGMYAQADAAIAKGLALIAEGARILDIGGESTRPGAQPVSADEEIARIMPVLEVFRDVDVALSVDTRHASVMKAALDAGADIINDISGFCDPQAQALIASHPNCGVCIMHMQGDPLTMQMNPCYEDVILEVRDFLSRRAEAARIAGIGAQRICLDPGFGFGKTVQHNLELLRGLSSLLDLDFPLLVGLSRKSVLGAVTGKGTDDRVHSSIAAALFAVQRGARIVRVHDVAAMHNALAVWSAIELNPMET
jgi:dihydropteroate synthase